MKNNTNDDLNDGTENATAKQQRKTRENKHTDISYTAQGQSINKKTTSAIQPPAKRPHDMEETTVA